jgi:hypothetical protein
MFAWSKKKAALYNGIILGGFGVLAVITVMAGKSLVKKYKEKYLMLFGYVILLVSMVILLPWGDERPPLQIASKTIVEKYSQKIIKILFHLLIKKRLLRQFETLQLRFMETLPQRIQRQPRSQQQRILQRAVRLTTTGATPRP